ncbi:hypothetical protein Zmor_017767 [Zophobas morio]|uniref:Uncharacterized protein n=1 Tax=Zophobas morio TaxID=2755281 RepID=A0AA38ID13_9CUCU|nr:hypothetical protein Zmor_017767 [Zophobas morio]
MTPPRTSDKFNILKLAIHHPRFASATNSIRTFPVITQIPVFQTPLISTQRNSQTLQPETYHSHCQRLDMVIIPQRRDRISDEGRNYEDIKESASLCIEGDVKRRE